MPNVLLAIGEGIEVAAKDALDFFEQIGKDVVVVMSPRALIALSLLAVPVGEAVATSAAAAAQDGLNIPLDAEAAQLIVQLWPDFMNYVRALSIQPPKGKTP